MDGVLGLVVRIVQAHTNTCTYIHMYVFLQQQILSLNTYIQLFTSQCTDPIPFISTREFAK